CVVSRSLDERVVVKIEHFDRRVWSLGQSLHELGMVIQRRNQRPKQLSNCRSHQVPMRSLDRASIIKQVKGMLKPICALIYLGLYFITPVSIRDAILDPIPQLERKRVAGPIKVRGAGTQEVADSLGA
ncbi:hypothetical protein MNBD_DELTA03-1709, partial [hydrothermal vent metagenome]